MGGRYVVPVGPRALDSIPRAGIGHWPTPLERMDRLRDALGGPAACPELWVKREDCSGLAFGGNKVRKLDYELGTAIADGIEVVVTYGALQSNHARQTAAACAKLGLECHLVLYLAVDRDDPLYVEGGNRLLDDLLGATVWPIPLGPDTFTLADAAVDAAVAGRRALVIPAGGSDTLGTLGYVAATAEWVEQSRAAPIDRVLMAVSTGGTYAGTLTGFKRTGLRARALGVCVHADVASTRAPSQNS